MLAAIVDGIHMQVYTREELFTFCSRDVIPARSVRKAIFSHRLWQPAHDRKQSWWKTQRSSLYAASSVCLSNENQDVLSSKGRRSVRKLSPYVVKFGLLNAHSVGNSSTAIATTIDEGQFDVFLLTETWHTTSQDTALRRCVPSGYVCLDVPRPTTSIDKQNYGGVAAIISDTRDYRRVSMPFEPKTFEMVAFTVGSLDATVAVLLIYRPGSKHVSTAFFKELEACLEVFALYKCQIVVAGDFNVHVEKVGDTNASHLQDILDSFDCIQHVPLTPTYRDGGTLDLVITKSEQVVVDMLVGQPDVISDHSLISWSCPLDRQPSITYDRQVRGWTRLDQDGFRAALLASELCSVDQRPSTTEAYFDTYNTVSSKLADRFAPVKRVTLRRQKLALWMDDECRKLRRISRVMERRYRRSGLLEDRLAWVSQERSRHQVYRKKERDYWSMRTSEQAKQPRKLWQTLNTLLGASNSHKRPTSCPTAQEFADFFEAKVAAVRKSTSAGTASTELPVATEIFDCFQPCTVDDVQSTILGAPSKSCTLDPLPTDVLKKFLPELLPFITDMCNLSLEQGCIPLSQRHAIITPRLKKAGADPTEVQNYRPVSNLSFISKVVEKLVCRQLVAFCERLGLLPNLQSAYRKNHSTETAVLKVISDILLAADSGQITLLCMLDMSAAFDTVDHEILLDRLEQSFGIHGRVLSWIKSFLHGRTQSVSCGGQQSSKSTLVCGVPQGSVLGPILFLIYCADVILIALRHGFRVHSYADDTQLYFHADPSEADNQVQLLTTCVEDISQWMSANRLKINKEKTQFIWLGTPHLLTQIQCQSVKLGGVDIQTSTEAMFLGVLLDNTLSFAQHVRRGAGKCFYFLRQLRIVRRSLTEEAAKTMVHAFIASRIDYCNSILHGMSATHMRPLQNVLNAAARLVLRKRKFDHITAAARNQLHWLPIAQRVEFKVCLFVSKCLRNSAPTYLVEMCVPVSTKTYRSHLRSAAHGDLVAPSFNIIIIIIIFIFVRRAMTNRGAKQTEARRHEDVRSQKFPRCETMEQTAADSSRSNHFN